MKGFTLIELLVVIAVLAVLAALLFPVFAGTREKGRQAVCIHNEKQLGMASSLYLQDYDEAFPSNNWWANTFYPYIKSVRTYHCPTDGNWDVHSRGSTAYALSYEINGNALFNGDASLSTQSVFTSPAQTVLFFEVTRLNVQILDYREGIVSEENGPPQFSGFGDGVDGELINTGANSPDGPPAQYATGKMDNSEPVEPFVEQYEDASGRHQSGSNFTAEDGHVKWLMGRRVSAGEDALGSDRGQSHTGCPYHGTPPNNNQPCAAGTSDDKHTLTFSTR